MATDSPASRSADDSFDDRTRTSTPGSELLRPEDINALVGEPTEHAPPERHAARLSPVEVEKLLARAEQALQSLDKTVADIHTPIKDYQLPEFNESIEAPSANPMEMLGDVELNLKIELGRTHMVLDDVLQLRQGSVVPLDKQAGEPVDILVNGRLIARGEVVVLHDNFCVRVVELISIPPSNAA